VPDVRVLHMETPSPHTRFGIKGMGEGGAIAPPAAVVNAVNDALIAARDAKRAGT
jgi:carbon-monoxide dehydrogenase large subunit